MHQFRNSVLNLVCVSNPSSIIAMILVCQTPKLSLKHFIFSISQLTRSSAVLKINKKQFREASCPVRTEALICILRADNTNPDAIKLSLKVSRTSVPKTTGTSQHQQTRGSFESFLKGRPRLVW